MFILQCDSTISDLNNIEISTSVLWRGGADEQKVFNFGRDSAEMYFTPSNENGVAEFVIRYGDIENKLTAEKPLTKGEWSVVRIIHDRNFKNRSGFSTRIFG